MTKLLRKKDVAEMTGISVSTLEHWRLKNEGPHGVRVGKHVLYRIEDVEAWVEEKFSRAS